MSQFVGVYKLQTTDELLQKLQYDYNRLLASPRSTFVYAAFDFFVTAYHMLDWVFPGDDKAQDRANFKKNNPIIKVCAHIANNAKHFRATNSQNYSVQHLDYVDIPPISIDDQSEGFYITFNENELSHFGRVMRCEVLAKNVLEFWENYLKKL